MALPSAVTLGSVAFVVAAGVGLVAVTSNASEQPARHATTTSDKPTAPAKDKSSKQAKSEPRKDTPRRKHHINAVPKVFVEVYNNAGITGLAADKATVLQDAGWNVTATDNWYGNIPASTVYYPARLHASAKQLAKVLHIARLRPAVSPMQFDRLTVIFTSP